MIKRALDLVFVILIIIILIVPVTILAFIVKVKMGSPIIFKQKRPGYKGKIFKMFKFRTMTNELDMNGILLPNEMRLTKFGKFLRKTSMDEMPELLNVLIGDMSLVGPRPLRIEYLEYYSKEQARRHDVKPGITGWAQINGRNAISWDEKFKLDIWYVDNQSLLLDIKILWLTFFKVIKKEGVNTQDDNLIKPFKGAKLNG